MAIAESTPLSDQFPRCAHCGGVIGVYEPIIRVIGGAASTTSQAAAPNLTAASDGELYHAVCHELARGRSDR